MAFHITTSQGTGALVSFSVTNHSTFQPFHYSTSLTLQFRPILSFSVILNLFQDLHVILRRTSRGWKALAIPVYCECEKPKDLLKNFTVILRLSRRIPLKRHEILRAPPSEWHVRCDGVLRSFHSLRMTWLRQNGALLIAFFWNKPFNHSTIFTLHASLC